MCDTLTAPQMEALDQAVEWYNLDCRNGKIYREERRLLKEGDVITELGDRPITSLEEGYLAREQYRAGDWLKVTYSRAGALKTVELRLGDQLEAGEGNF